jgi:heme o synthase
MPSKLSLIKPVLSLAIAFSAAAGFIFYSHIFSPALPACIAGVFLLSAGAAALNQYQEREQDAVMERTRDRPVPSGAVSPVSALTAAALLALAGAAILWIFTGWLPALLGVANLVWYNAVYTPLKRRTHIAVLAGSLNGAVPPVIGWTAAGGSILNPEILFLAVFIYTWQVPHFWLLLMMYGNEYRKAGFKTVADHIRPGLQPIVIMAWILATAAGTLFLPLFGIIDSIAMVILIITSVVLMVSLMTIFLFRKGSENNYRKAFIVFNIFMLATFLLVIADQLM